ncbi:hypothetical protein JW948_05905 [bacterium]|nr:hypothetical protein [bacterium]
MSSATTKQNDRMINFVGMGLFFSLFYWILESIRDVIAFNKGSLIERIFYPDSMSLWMRVLVVCMILGFSALVQSMRQRAESGKMNLDFLGRNTTIFISLAFGLVYWIIEAWRDAFLYNRGTFLQQAFNPDSLGFWMRILAILILVLFGVYVKTLIEDRQKAQESLDQVRNLFMKESDSQLKRLQDENAHIKKEMQSRDWQEKELRELLRLKESNLRSVHQTMKTNLQFLNSLFDVRIMIASEEAHRNNYMEIRTLVYSLTLLHTHLHKSDQFNQINLSDYMHGITEFLFHSHQSDPIKVHMDSAHILMPVSQVVPLAFTICELIFLSGIRRHMEKSDDNFQILVKRTDDDALSVKIRHRDQELLPGIENEEVKNEYRWVRELIDQQLRGDFWVIRNAQGIDMNIVFKLRV